jgi:DHA1 family multidrug resistance protein-like MFS transporter
MVAPVRVLYAQSHGASLAIIGAMATAFLLANFAAQYPSGLLADRIGRRTVILLGVAVQALLTLSYLAVQDPTLFVVLRLLEGVAAALVLPSARALVADITPVEERGQAYGLFSACFNAGFLLGPGLGGLLAGFGYATVFVAAVLCRVLAFLLALRTLPLGNRRPEHAGDDTRSFRPLLQPALLGAYVLAFGDYLYFGFDQTLMPLWIRHNLGAPVVAIGVLFMLWALPNMLLSPLTGRLADRRRRSTLILVFGLAQVPLYLAYGFVGRVVLVGLLFTLHSVIYTLVQPAVDAHVSAAAPASARARVQSLYGATGLVGAFVGATALAPLYSLNWRLPLPAVGIVFGLCVLAGGSLIRAHELPPVAPSD